MRSLLGSLSLALLLTSCGGGGGSGPSVDITGTYRVNGATSRGETYTGTMRVQQSGSHLSGTYDNSLGRSARITGTVSGTHASGQLIGTNNPAVCDAEADLLPDGREGHGSYTCRAGGVVIETGSFTTSRVE